MYGTRKDRTTLAIPLKVTYPPFNIYPHKSIFQIISLVFWMFLHLREVHYSEIFSCVSVKFLSCEREDDYKTSVEKERPVWCSDLDINSSNWLVTMEIKDLKIDPHKAIWSHVKTAGLRFNLSSLPYSFESSAVENSSAFYFRNF